MTKIENEYQKTIDYLSLKYNVVMSYNHIDNPTAKYKKDVLYKVYIRQKDVMWVYLQAGTKEEYFSVEIEPEYIENVSRPISGFYKSITRKTKPHNKYFFSNFESVKISLDVMLDSIEKYFGVEKKASGINEPMPPKSVITNENKTYSVVCGKCESLYKLAERCPECGQKLLWQNENK